VTIHPKDQSKFEKIMAGTLYAKSFCRKRWTLPDNGAFRQTDYQEKISNSKMRGKSRLILGRVNV